MNNAAFITITRQTGLMREMQVVAHNIANASTTGFRREGVIFAEHIRTLEAGEASLSMALAHGRSLSTAQGPMVRTGGTLDLAIEGAGYFLIETAEGERLTRSGAFARNADGGLVTHAGQPVLDVGGAPIVIPPGPGVVAIAADGTITAGDQPLAQIAVVMPAEEGRMLRQSGLVFIAEDGVEPVADPALLQGHLEDSNVDPVTELARMIEVQRAYELGQQFMDREDERIRSVIRSLSS